MKNRARDREKREKRKQLYLEKLVSLGKYDPDRPTKPDPERWLPKNQRSYNKKGRKNRSKYSGAQGAGAGGINDAFSLDAASKLYSNSYNPKPFSTAHLAPGSKQGKRNRPQSRR